MVPKNLSEHIRLLFQRRELLYQLTLKDLKVRYKGSALGVLWSFLNPLLMMIVFTIVFSHVFRSNVRNYPVFLLCGYIPWLFFSTTVLVSTKSVIENSGLVKKVFFPKEVFPLSSVLSNLVNFLLQLCLLFIFLLAFGIMPTAFFLLLPLLIIIEIILTAGISFYLSGLTVFFRDVEQLVSLVVMVWFFLTPVFYPIVDDAGVYMVPQKYLFLYLLNPMASITLAFRDIMMYGKLLHLKALCLSTFVSVLIFASGYVVFKRLEPKFAERI